MGIEYLGGRTEAASKEAMSIEQGFGELAKKELEMKGKARDIFRENAELNGALLYAEDLNFSVQQRRYFGGQLKNIRNEAKEALQELRNVTGFEIPDDLRGVGAADSYYEKIKKAA
jgi:hypothetical protein